MGSGCPKFFPVTVVCRKKNLVTVIGSVHETVPQKGMATHDCKGIYSHGWPYFWLGGHLTTTLIVKWPGASFGDLAPRWYPRFCRELKKKIKDVHSPWTLVHVGLMITQD